MFPFFHLFLPLVILEISIRISPRNTALYGYFTRFWLCIGALLPDLIDKPLSLLSQSTSGRGIGHAPFFTIAILSLLLILTKKKFIIVPIIIGNIVHLLLDIPEVPWLWPFIPLDLYISDLNAWLYTLLHDPLVLSTELLALGGLLVFIIHYHILFYHGFINGRLLKLYLFSTPQEINNFKNNM